MDTPPQSAAPSSYDRVDMAAVVRRHAHDVRNYINCIDLESALLEEVVTDPEAIESVRRIRSQLAQMDGAIQSLSVKFVDPQPITISAADLLQLWKNQIQPLEESVDRVRWSGPVEPKLLSIDPQVIMCVLRELVCRALKRNAEENIVASVRTTEDAVLAQLREAAPRLANSDDWLPELVRLVKRNGGTCSRETVAGSTECVTTLYFPAVAK